MFTRGRGTGSLREERGSTEHNEEVRDEKGEGSVRPSGNKSDDGQSSSLLNGLKSPSERLLLVMYFLVDETKVRIP